MFRSEPSQHFCVDRVPTLAWTESAFLRGQSPLLVRIGKSRNLFKIVSVLLSASVERVGVSRMRDFFIIPPKSVIVLV